LSEAKPGDGIWAARSFLGFAALNPGYEALPARHAHMPRQRRALVPPVDNEIVAFGLARNRFFDAACRRSLPSEAEDAISAWPEPSPSFDFLVSLRGQRPGHTAAPVSLGLS
jgi:hypothetical protein